MSVIMEAPGNPNWMNFRIHLEALVVWTKWCTWRPWSTKFGVEHGCWDWVNPDIHLEAVTEQFERWTGREWLSELRDALGGHDQANLEIDQEPIIVWTSKPWSSKFENARGCHISGNWKAVSRWVWRWTWVPWYIEIRRVLGGSRSGGGGLGGRGEGSWDSIHLLPDNHGNVESWVRQDPPNDERWEMTERLGVRDSWSWNDVILSFWSTWCMVYLVYAVLGVCCISRMLYSVLAHNYGMER